jgi:MFS family permease
MPENYRRNFWCLAMDFCFFGLGMAFFGPSTVTPSFLTALGASTTVIGLLSTLQRAGWLLPQLIAARYLADKPYKKPYILVPAAVSRSMLFVLAALIWLFGGERRGLMVGLTITTLAIFWVGDGLASLAWFDFLSKAIPANRRGRLTSTGQILSGAMGFAAGFAVEWMLSDGGPMYPRNYAFLFLIGFGMLTVSFTALALGVEKKGVTAARVPTWTEYLPQLSRVLKKDHSFRRYLVTRQVFGLAGLATPFYMTYALDMLGLPDQVAGRYTSVGVIGGIVAAAVFGWANERRGTKWASQISIGITAAVPVAALLIPHLLKNPVWLAWGYGLVFLAMQASMSCYLPAWTAYVLEWAPDAERPLYVGLTNTVNGFTALFSTLGGLLLQWSNDNYQLLFLITAVGTLAALPLSFGLPEPRVTDRASVLAEG